MYSRYLSSLSSLNLLTINYPSCYPTPANSSVAFVAPEGVRHSRQNSRHNFLPFKGVLPNRNNHPILTHHTSAPIHQIKPTELKKTLPKSQCESKINPRTRMHFRSFTIVPRASSSCSLQKFVGVAFNPRITWA